MFLPKLTLPHPRNKKRSVLLQHSALLSYVFFIGSLIFSSYLIVVSVPNVLGYATNIKYSDLLLETNKKRSSEGISTLVINDKLSRAAYFKAKDMFEKDYWAHISPTGKEPWDFILASGYDYVYAGENLAVDFDNSKDVVKAWYNSPSHKANLLNSNYTDIGFAVVNGELQGRKTTLIVQMFGYPRNVTMPRAELPTSVAAESVEQEELILQQTLQSATELQAANVQGAVLNSSNVFNASKYLAVIFGLFLTMLFAIDGYYVRRYGIYRISGHTMFHIVILILVVVGVWYTSIGLIL